MASSQEKETEYVLKCQVCKEICKRGVNLPCCGTQACRACATKQITKSRKCWNLTCLKEAKTDDLVNDDDLRDATAKLKAGQPIPAAVLQRIQSRFQESEIEMIVDEDPKLSSKPTSAASTPSSKPTSAVPTTSSKPTSAAPTTSSKPTSAASTTSSKPTSAVPTTAKPATTTPAKPTSTTPNASKPSPTTPKSTSTTTKPSPTTPNAPKNPVTPTPKSPLSAAKRKSDLPSEIDSKKGKLEKNPLKIFLDAEIILQSFPNLSQICIKSSESDQVFFSAVPAKFLKPGSPESLLNKHHLRKKTGFVAAKTSPFQFVKEDQSKVDCTVVYETLTKAINFVREIKKKNPGRELVLVMYCELMYKLLYKVLKNVAYYKEFKAIFDSVLTFEQYFAQTSKQKVDVKPINELFTPVRIIYSCAETVKLLQRLDREKVEQAVFLNLRVPSLEEKIEGLYTSKEPGQYCKISSVKIKPDFQSIAEKCNPQPVSKPVGTASKPVVTSLKPVSKPAVVTKSILKPTPKVEEPDHEEIIILEDDQVTAETVYLSGLYAVFVHPVLLHLSGLEAGTRAVSFKSDLYAYKPMNPAKVYWKGKDAYTFYNIRVQLNPANRTKSFEAKIIRSIGEKKEVLDVKKDTRRMEETRPLNKVVKVNLVYNTDTNPSTSYTLNDNTAVLLVKLVPHDNATINNKNKDLMFTSSDVFMYLKSKVSGLEIISHLFSPDTRNLARVVFRSPGGMKISPGQVLGTALLLQEENISLALLKAEQHEQTIKKMLATNSNSPNASNSPTKSCVLTSRMKRPCHTLETSCLYSGIMHPVLVLLKNFEVTQLAKKFSEAQFEFKKDFVEAVSLDLASRAKKTCPVFWHKNIPYAFLQITLSGQKLKTTLVKADAEIATFSPIESVEPKPLPSIEMSACIDFSQKNLSVDLKPVLVKVYLKFTKSEVPKREVLDQIFAVNNIYNAKLRILNIVFKPLYKEHLAPQKTQTNDMMAELVIASRDGTIYLNPREVIADVSSVGARLGGDINSLDLFKSSGVRVIAQDTFEQEDRENERRKEEDRRAIQERAYRMKERAREFQVNGLFNRRMETSESHPGPQVHQLYPGVQEPQGPQVHQLHPGLQAHQGPQVHQLHPGHQIPVVHQVHQLQQQENPMFSRLSLPQPVPVHYLGQQQQHSQLPQPVPPPQIGQLIQHPVYRRGDVDQMMQPPVHRREDIDQMMRPPVHRRDEMDRREERDRSEGRGGRYEERDVRGGRYEERDGRGLRNVEDTGSGLRINVNRENEMLDRRENMMNIQERMNMNMNLERRSPDQPRRSMVPDHRVVEEARHVTSHGISNIVNTYLDRGDMSRHSEDRRSDRRSMREERRDDRRHSEIGGSRRVEEERRLRDGRGIEDVRSLIDQKRSNTNRDLRDELFVSAREKFFRN